MPDYKKLLEDLKANPRPVETPQSLAADIARLNYAEQVRVQKLVAAGGLAALQKERDQDSSNYRREQERLGRLAQAAESKRLTDAIEQKRQEHASVLPPTE